MYQISNQITLGIDERDSVKQLQELVKMVIEKERSVRKSRQRKAVTSLRT